MELIIEGVIIELFCAGVILFLLVVGRQAYRISSDCGFSTRFRLRWWIHARRCKICVYVPIRHR